MKVVVKKKDNAIPVRGKKLRPGDRFVCDGQAYQIITHESE